MTPAAGLIGWVLVLAVWPFTAYLGWRLVRELARGRDLRQQIRTCAREREILWAELKDFQRLSQEFYRVTVSTTDQLVELRRRVRAGRRLAQDLLVASPVPLSVLGPARAVAAFADDDIPMRGALLTLAHEIGRHSWTAKVATLVERADLVEVVLPDGAHCPDIDGLVWRQRADGRLALVVPRDALTQPTLPTT